MVTLPPGRHDPLIVWRAVRPVSSPERAERPGSEPAGTRSRSSAPGSRSGAAWLHELDAVETQSPTGRRWRHSTNRERRPCPPSWPIKIHYETEHIVPDYDVAGVAVDETSAMPRPTELTADRGAMGATEPTWPVGMRPGSGWRHPAGRRSPARHWCCSALGWLGPQCRSE